MFRLRCNVPFFCGYAKRCFYGFSDDFSFFAVHSCRKRKVCRVCQPAPWMKQAATHSRANREERLFPPGWTSTVGSETFILPCRWFALFTLPVMSFIFQSVLLFLRIFPEVFFYSNLPLFSFTSILRLSVESHQAVIFVLGAKVIPGFDGKARSSLLFSAKISSPSGSILAEKPCIP